MSHARPASPTSGLFSTDLNPCTRRLQTPLHRAALREMQSFSQRMTTILNRGGLRGVKTGLYADTRSSDRDLRYTITLTTAGGPVVTMFVTLPSARPRSRARC